MLAPVSGTVFGVRKKSSYRGFLILQIIKVPIEIPGTAYRGFLIVGEHKVTEQRFL